MHALAVAPVAERPRAPSRTVPPAPASWARGGPAAVLALQRLVGNAGVSQLLTPVQRCGDHVEPGCPCADEAPGPTDSAQDSAPVVARQSAPPAPPAAAPCLAPGTRRVPGSDVDSVDQAILAGCLDEAFAILNGHAMYGLLPLLDALRARASYAQVRSNVGLGGPRLATAISAVDLKAAGPITGAGLRGLVDQMATLNPDQRRDILRFIGMGVSITVQGLEINFSYVAGAAGGRTCKDRITEAAKFDKKMQTEYAACRGKPGIKNSDDVEACVTGSLAKQGVGTSVGGTTSQTGAVVVNSGPMSQCEPIRTRHTEIHEAVHASTQKKLAKKYGAGTPAMDAAWDDPNNWIDDEINAYAAGHAFYQEVIKALTLLEGKVPK